MTTADSLTTEQRELRRPSLAVVIGMIALAALYRVVPHPANLAPIGAMALFGGAALADRRLALVIPMLAMLASDLFIGFDSSRIWVYTSIALITVLGRTLQNHRRNPLAIATGSFGASLLFFVATNFGTWLMSGWYGHTFSELVRCFTMAIPFFGSTVVSDLVFSGVLFGGLALVESWASSTQSKPVEA